MTINPKRLILLSNATSNSNGEAKQWAGTGAGSLQIVGTFDTATVTIEGSLDGGLTWTAVQGGAFTAAAITSFIMGNALVRAVLSSVGASTDISVYLTPQETT